MLPAKIILVLVSRCVCGAVGHHELGYKMNDNKSEKTTLDVPRAKGASKQWNERQRQRQKMMSIKTREREMKQAKEDEKERKVQIRKEREAKAAEKERLEAMAARVCVLCATR